MDWRRYRSESRCLLLDSPLTDLRVVGDVEDFLVAGEYALALDTLCSWMYEDALPVGPSHHGRLVAMAGEVGREYLGTEELVEAIAAQVVR